MAKWGEGDPRWIVEERPDATNVNNWHWTEKNATDWSKAKLKELLVGLTVENDDGSCSVSEVTSIEGEASANNRKAKLIFFYELVIKLKWKGTTKTDHNASGTVSIPNLSEENDVDDLDITVSLTGTEDAESRKLKSLMHSKGQKEIRKRIGDWMKALKEEYATDLIKPTNTSQPQANNVANSALTTQTTTTSSNSSSSSSLAKESTFKSIDLTDSFKCAASDLFSALLDERKVAAYTGGETKIDAKSGGNFSMFSGNVHGTIKELVPNERIVMAWRFKSWTEGHYSEVVMQLTEKDDSTSLKLSQTGVPASDYERTKEGWHAQQFERMKAILGFGTHLGFSF